MTWDIGAAVAGGVGLFLLGMWLMTEGLKLAAGDALRAVLARGTRTPLRAFAAGALITAVVQSSSAVTVATIGFVNAGLMGLTQAVAVIVGANIGTTVTGWLVAAVGFQLDIAAFALPAVGLGMLARAFVPDARAGAAGQAVAGFGVLFLGIGVLKSTFVDIGALVDLGSLAGGGATVLLVSVGLGVLLTALTQSSSAAIAIILTAVGGGAIPLSAGAALVIGANVGTTTTAMLAVVGATPNARRAAAAHVAFNAIAAAAALALLPLLLAVIVWLQPHLDIGAGPASLLALFHTLFNVLGALLVWPFLSPLVARLEGWFRAAEEDEARPRYLDRNVLATPVLAVHALARELARIGAIAGRMARGALDDTPAPAAKLAAGRGAVDRLVDAVGTFSGRLARAKLPAHVNEVLPAALRVSRYYTETAQLAQAVALSRRQREPLTDLALRQRAAAFRAEVARVIALADVESTTYSAEEAGRELALLQQRYQEVKSAFLRAGSEGRVPVRPMVEVLDALSDMRRMAEQMVKGARYLGDLVPPASLPIDETAAPLHKEGETDEGAG